MKILTLNTWQERGPWQVRWGVILEGLKHLRPEIAGFQEVFNHDWAQDIKRKSKFGYLVFHPEPSGLMLLSQFPVLHSECLTFRTQSPTEDYLRYALYAELEIRKKKSIAVFNTHLSWKLDEGSVREGQVEELIEFIQLKARGKDALVMGDFNATSDSSEVRRVQEQAGLTDTFAQMYPHDPGLTWNHINPYARNAGHPMPDRRIDYIFYSREFHVLPELKSADIVFNHPNDSGIWASDHFGLLAAFGEGDGSN